MLMKISMQLWVFYFFEEYFFFKKKKKNWKEDLATYGQPGLSNQPDYKQHRKNHFPCYIMNIHFPVAITYSKKISKEFTECVKKAHFNNQSIWKYLVNVKKNGKVHVVCEEYSFILYGPLHMTSTCHDCMISVLLKTHKYPCPRWNSNPRLGDAGLSP